MKQKITFHLADKGTMGYTVFITVFLGLGVIFEKVSLSIISLVLFFALLFDKGHIKIEVNKCQKK